MEQRRRIGILGGTFDPPHNGHLFLAQDAQEQLDLDAVLFIPAAVPPLKGREPAAPAALRLAMMRAAIAAAGDAGRAWEASDCELRRGGVSYSVDTALELRRRFGTAAQLFWLIGADQAAQLRRWHRAAELLQLVHFVVAERDAPPPPAVPATACSGGTPAGGGEEILRLRARRVDISSSEIRERCRRGLSLDLFLPAPVAEIIRAQHIYS